MCVCMSVCVYMWMYVFYSTENTYTYRPVTSCPSKGIAASSVYAKTMLKIKGSLA